MNEPPSYQKYLLPPFEGSKLKLQRARCHLEEFENTLSLYAKDVEVRFGPFDTERSRRRVYFTPSPPSSLPLIFGDFIHNTRSSLDILVIDVARRREKSIDKIKFPFAEDETKLEILLNKDFRRLGDDVVAALSSQKPFNGGNRNLRLIHDLDIDDKHKLVLPTYAAAATVMDGSRIMAESFAQASGQSILHYKQSGPISLAVMQAEGDGVLIGLPIFGQSPYVTYLREGEDVYMPSDGDHTRFFSDFTGEIVAQFPKQHPKVPGANMVSTARNLLATANKVFEEFSSQFG
ncbi:hypothetical protein [Ciceribacter selenitireducens]